ncbi:hypothetical protein, partial [Umezawaea beigongshangensis]|uniref:hypothetical protein n=1 Tax=Umezawaea beigongshangensis TaxID=2780383 RepID=UPI001E491D94
MSEIPEVDLPRSGTERDGLDDYSGRTVPRSPRFAMVEPEDRRRSSQGVRMFERFTDRARRVVVLAQEEARMLNHN